MDRLEDQLHRASTSITNNIAEGAGEFAPAEKRRFYRMARRSTTESAAILDAVRCCKLLEDPTPLGTGRELLLQIVKMLTRLATDRSGKGKGKGTFKCSIVRPGSSNAGSLLASTAGRTAEV